MTSVWKRMAATKALFERYPELQRLGDWIASRHVSIAVEPGPAALGEADARTLCFTTPDLVIRLVVLDEYGDARAENDMLCVLLAREELEELKSGTFENWAQAHGLVADAASRAVWEANSAADIQIRAQLGDIPDVLDAMDWQLNAGAAQALRQL